MKPELILGLDIGVSSVGIALIKKEKNNYSIEKLACRIVPEDPNFHGKFYTGLPASKNENRTLKRGIRRNNQRFKQRKKNLYNVLLKNDMMPSDDLIHIDAMQLYRLRSESVEKKLSLKEIGRVFIHLNQRRGFLSNRKSNSKEEKLSDYKLRIKELEDELNDKTIGQILYRDLKSVAYPHQTLLRERTYQRQSYIEEFDRIWEKQKEFYPDKFTGSPNDDPKVKSFYNHLKNKIIFYQRPLKSQKDLVSDCPFEKYNKAVSKSSLYFEMFRIWQKINDLEWKDEQGTCSKPTLEQKQKLFNALFYGENLNPKFKLNVTNIKSILGFKRRELIYLNFTELDGSRTYSTIRNALIKANIAEYTQYLKFDLTVNDEKGGLFELWHLTYSISDETELVNAIIKRFGWSHDQAKTFCNEVNYPADYGRLSTRAIRKLLPHMMKGLSYTEACEMVGYDHSGSRTDIEIEDQLKPLYKNKLRNPVVEQVLNQVVNMVNMIVEQYGPLNEIRVELARELRNSAKARSNITANNTANKKANDALRKRLIEEYGYKIVNGRDIKRYRLWEETKNKCLYCSENIKLSELKDGYAELEHIIPKSRSFNNAMSNLILAHRHCNAGRDGKNQLTAYDFMKDKKQKFDNYIMLVNDLYKNGEGSISKTKFENLMCKGEDIPSDFVERMKKDTQYISKEAVNMLKKICPNVFTTTGQVTDLLRSEWQLKNVLQEITLEKYRLVGETELKEFKDSRGNINSYEKIKNWSKRDDHRHHAIDALICALTNQKTIFKLNNLNKIYQAERNTLGTEKIKALEESLEGKFTLKEFFNQKAHFIPCPIKDLRAQTKNHLDQLLISFKKHNSKVLTANVNPSSGKICWTPRGQLHQETVMAGILKKKDKPTKINKQFLDWEMIIDPLKKNTVITHLHKYGNDPVMAFDSKTLKKDPIKHNDKILKEVYCFEKVCSKRVEINDQFTSAQLKKVIDHKIQKTLIERIEKYNGNTKAAFGNLKDDPIWLNKAKGIQVRRVSVYDNSKVEMVNKGYAVLGNNHHALIYKDEDGKYHDKMISFWDAVEIGLLNIRQHGKPYPIIDRNNYDEYGVFQFSIQKNDLFAIDLIHSSNPTEENEIDFFDPENRKLISKKLFRVQKMSKNSAGQFIINFRHHLETTIVRNDKVLKGIIWDRFSSNQNFERVTKVKINHIGDIVKVGE